MRKYSELDMAHPFFSSLSFFSLPAFHVSSPSLKSGFHVLTHHVGHGGQDRSKTKAEEAFGFNWFWSVLHQESRLTFYAYCSQRTASLTSLFWYLWVGRRTACSTLPPLKCHVFSVCLFLYICAYDYGTVSGNSMLEGLLCYTYMCLSFLLRLLQVVVCFSSQDLWLDTHCAYLHFYL